jgi:hypothetical protein
MTLFYKSTSNSLSHLVMSHVNFTFLSRTRLQELTSKLFFFWRLYPLCYAYFSILLNSQVPFYTIDPWFVLADQLLKLAICLVFSGSALVPHSTLKNLVNISKVLSFHLVLQCCRHSCKIKLSQILVPNG